MRSVELWCCVARRAVARYCGVGSCGVVHFIARCDAAMIGADKHVYYATPCVIPSIPTCLCFFVLKPAVVN